MDESNVPPSGVERRLDDVITELRGLRADLAAQKSAPAAPDGQVELREPKRERE